MSKNEVIVPCIFLLVFSSSMFSSKLAVFGSSDTEPSFKRPDPLSHFKYYRGGYDLRNKHYWASAAFTGVHGYAIAGLWMLCGVGLGVYLGVRNSHQHSPQSPQISNYRIMLILVVSFTFLAIVASSFALATNGSSFHKAKKLKQTILEAGEEVRRAIRNIIQALTDMQYLIQPYQPALSSRLNTTIYRLGNQSTGIGDVLQKSGHTFDFAIKTSFITHLVVIIANLLLLGAAIVLLVLHWYPRLIVIIFFCWILTTLLWAIYGFDFFFHTFAEDTCSALEYYEEHDPQNSTLNSMLPCMNSSYGDKTLVEIGSNIYKYINQLNSGIAHFGSIVLNKQVENKATVLQIIICNPFTGPPTYDYEPNNCSKGAIPISNIPQVLEPFICHGDDAEKCRGNGQFLPEASYYQVWACCRAVQDFLNIYPDLQNLSKCTFVKNKFKDVFIHQCKPFKLVTRLLGFSMLGLSIFMVVLVLTWVIIYIRRRKYVFSI